jgi:hypothetical protein
MDTDQTKQFINNSKHAMNHLFSAIDEYNKVWVLAQKEVEEIESSQKRLGEIFMYSDQWSVNANHHHAQYIERMKHLDNRKKIASSDISLNLTKALDDIGATEDSMSCLAGAILQVAKQVLSLRHSGKPTIPDTRHIGNQSIIEVIWEGRNHAMHWDEGAPRPRVQTMLNSLSSDLGTNIVIGNNNCLSILHALGWSSTEAVINDLETLIQ